MNRIIALTLTAVPLLASCVVSNVQYRPANKPESKEFAKDLLDVYPGEIRRNIDAYTNVAVAWAGIIRNTDGSDGRSNMIHAVTTIEHRYFDWEEDRHLGNAKLNISPRGEGLFQTAWDLQRRDPNVTSHEAEIYAAPGDLAIVYGVPERVEQDVVVLKYRYIRIIDPKNFSTNIFDYGRFGEPFRYIDTTGK